MVLLNYFPSRICGPSSSSQSPTSEKIFNDNEKAEILSNNNNNNNNNNNSNNSNSNNVNDNGYIKQTESFLSFSYKKQSSFMKSNSGIYPKKLTQDLWDYLVDRVVTISVSRPRFGLNFSRIIFHLFWCLYLFSDFLYMFIRLFDIIYIHLISCSFIILLLHDLFVFQFICLLIILSSRYKTSLIYLFIV